MTKEQSAESDADLRARDEAAPLTLEDIEALTAIEPFSVSPPGKGD